MLLKFKNFYYLGIGVIRAVGSWQSVVDSFEFVAILFDVLSGIWK